MISFTAESHKRAYQQMKALVLTRNAPHLSRVHPQDLLSAQQISVVANQSACAQMLMQVIKLATLLLKATLHGVQMKIIQSNVKTVHAVAPY